MKFILNYGTTHTCDVFSLLTTHSVIEKQKFKTHLHNVGIVMKPQRGWRNMAS